MTCSFEHACQQHADNWLTRRYQPSFYQRKGYAIPRIDDAQVGRHDEPGHTAEYAVHHFRFGLSAAGVFPLDDGSDINELRLLSSTTWPARAARMTCNMEHMLANNRADNAYTTLIR